MSGTILYLAIVAIWVCVLVPRWLRRANSVAYDSLDTAQVSDAGVLDTTVLDDDLATQWPAAGPADKGDLAAAVSVTVPGASHWLPGGLTGGLRMHGRRAGAGSGAPDFTDTQPLPVVQPGPAGRPAPPARPQLSRSRILQARRRMLTMLLTLAVIALICTAAGLARWWICLPPAVMLGMYLLLLREVALADAENLSRDREHRAAMTARAARRRAREADAARVPEPTAEIIDISARVRDQLYDQYEDATARAVGD